MTTGQDAKLELETQDRVIIDEEVNLHLVVREAVKVQASTVDPNMSGIKTRLIELRDEAITASERDLPALFQQLYTHHSLATRNFDKKLPDLRSPYFAHMRLLEGTRTRDILIGQQTFIEAKAGVTIIDWRHAALAKVFFNYREGDEYEIELPGRVAIGTIILRRIITFDVGELVGISGPEFTFIRPKSGAWTKVSGDGLPILQGGAGKSVNSQVFGTGKTHQRLPDVSALLDSEQYGILSQAADQSLLILGGAGSGKTTVALHRMALLSFQNPKQFRPNQMRVVVPEHGLVRLIQRLLSGLGLDGTQVLTYDDWISDEANHILKGLPKRLCQWTPPSVIYAKRHPAMMLVVEQYVKNMAQSIVKRYEFLLGDSYPKAFEILAAPYINNRSDCLWERLAAIENLIRTQDRPTTQRQKDLVTQFLREARAEVLDVVTARSTLFVDDRLVQILIDHSQGTITQRTIDELRRHTRQQFESVTHEPQGSLGHNDDHEASRAVDGGEHEDEAYAGTIDVEDYSLLLYLMYRIHGHVMRKGKSLTKVNHLVVDEAQDLAPIELKLLGHSLSDFGHVTVAGDAAQQSDPGVIFQGWDQVIDHIDVGTFEHARLTTNYRCPRPIAEFAHHILGPFAPKELPRSLREGEPVSQSVIPHEGLIAITISETLSRLINDEPKANIAVICENDDKAKKVYDGLANLPEARLVIDGEFSFMPGIDVTYVSQVKGLEFDYVVIPDASPANYPNTAIARRNLHIGATRAVHQLWVVSEGRKSELLPPS